MVADVISSDALHDLSHNVTCSSPTSPVPVLSVLIPAYNFAPGVRRIVSPLLADDRTDLEIRVHDDSTGGEVEQFITPLLPRYKYLHYKRNTPPLGAIANWNGLLTCARGRYVILIHHDDFPLSVRFASEVIGELEQADWPDVLLLTCITYDQVRQRVKPGVWNVLRRWVAQRWPAYLLRRNILGPPSAVVLRRDLVQTFDPALTWLVDVDAYHRILSGGERRIVVSRQIMISSTGRHGSITNRIKDEKARITLAELAHIARKSTPCRRTPIFVSQTLCARIALKLEWLLWGGVKLFSMLYGTIARPNITLMDIVHRHAQSTKRE